MKQFLLALFFCTMLMAGVNNASLAQCAMCKQSAESSLKEGNTDAKGLNFGIMYLLVIPYILVGGIGYYWYIHHKKSEEAATEE
jgi:hypothetical protein